MSEIFTDMVLEPSVQLVAMADGGELEFRGAATPLGEGAVAVPRRLTYRHPGDSRRPAFQVDLEVVDGVPWCTNVTLTGEAGSRRVRPTDLKEITGSLDSLQTQILSAAAFIANPHGVGWIRRMDTARRSRPEINRSRRRERRKITPELLERVAEIYCATGTAGRTAAVKAAFPGISERTAGRYIQQARAAGLLAPTTKGRATDG